MKNKGNKVLVALICIVVVFIIGTGVFLIVSKNKKDLNSDNKNISSVATTAIKYGNVNGDNRIDVKDVTAIQKHISGKNKLTGKNLKAADVDLDGKISENDAKLIQKYIVRTVTKLPIKYGDANGDGRIDIKDATEIQKYVANQVKLTGNKLEAADVNLNGEVDNNDATLIQKYLVKSVTKLPVQYGDVNDDGKVDATDRMTLTRYLAKWKGYNSINNEAADVNLDDEVNNIDIDLIKRYLNKSISVLPIKYGDVNGDGVIDIKDATEIQKYVANQVKLTENQKRAADVNLDGKVNTNDATLIQKYIVKSIQYLPYTK